MSEMELIERVDQLERLMKQFRPELHFPSTATLEQRLRWLEIALEEMKAKDSHGVYAETPSDERLRQLLAHTVYIKNDRITLHSLTTDPGSCVGGDVWFRSDLGKSKQAIDAVVANARLLRREGDTIPTADVPDHMAKSKLAWTADKLLKGADAETDPTEISIGPSAGMVAAGDHMHSLVDDLVGSVQTGVTGTAFATIGDKRLLISGGADYDLATTTNTFVSNSRAVAVGYAHCSPWDDDTFKLRLYMGGVQVAESGYLAGGFGPNIILVGTRALSGSQVCKIALHNYASNGNVDLWSRYNGQPVGAGIGVGSIKI